MKANALVRPRSCLKLLVLPFALVAIGCGGGNYSPTPQPSPAQPSPAPSALSSIQGSWELQLQSQVSSKDYTVLEANLSQAGTRVFAGAPSALVYRGATLGTVIPLTSLGSKCDSGGVGQVTLDGTLTNQQPTTETINFTLTENGALGTAVITASASTNGSNILDGTYTIPDACSFPADHGTFTGYGSSVAFGADVYSGILNSGADVIVATFTSIAHSFDLSVSGTDNGAKFTLTGSTVGFSLRLTGNVGGKAVNWFGLYDTTYNSFLLYDSNDQLVGTLHAGANP